MPSWLKLARSRARILRRLSWADRLLLLEAWLLLGLARFLLVLLPFRWLVPWLNQVCAYQPGKGDAQRVGLALFYAAKVTPWRSMCFEQALAGRLMLQSRSLPSTLHLGVAKRAGVAQQSAALKAHAWLVCQGEIITGGPDVEQFGVVARFGEASSE